MGLPMRLAPLTGLGCRLSSRCFRRRALAMVVLRRKRRELLWLAPLWILPPLPAPPAPAAGNRTALLVQPNVPEDFDWTPESLHRFERSPLDLSLSAPLAKPEAPIPLYYHLDPGIRMDAQTLARLFSVRSDWSERARRGSSI